MPCCHNTGRSTMSLVVLAGQVESTVPSSANPTICPLLLIALACPLLPPSVGRALILPSAGRALILEGCQRNGRHVRWVPKRQTSSPFGSGAAVSESPTTCPESLISPHIIQLFGPPSVPRSVLAPSTSISARPLRICPNKKSTCAGASVPAMISVQP